MWFWETDTLNCEKKNSKYIFNCAQLGRAELGAETVIVQVRLVHTSKVKKRYMWDCGHRDERVDNLIAYETWGTMKNIKKKNNNDY